MARSSYIAAALALAVALASCGESTRGQPAPLDRFTYPTGLALHTLPDGRRVMIVVSSNFDLLYDPDEGGSVLVVDPEASAPGSLAILGSLRIPSFGGEAAILTSETCEGWTGGTQLLVPSRTANAAFRIEVGDDGSLTCGEGCRVDFNDSVADPYGVTLACGPRVGRPQQVAFFSHLRVPGGEGVLSQLSLEAGAKPTLIDIGDPLTQGFAYDAVKQRLYVTGRLSTLDLAPLRWLDLGAPTTVYVANVADTVRGADLRTVSLANPDPLTGARDRAYVAVRIFDPDLLEIYGSRPGDSGGALAVMDLNENLLGQPSGRVLTLVPVGVGPSEVEVLPVRQGRRDLVAVSSPDQGTVTLYDDDLGAVVRVLDRADAGDAAAGYTPGQRLFGESPMGLASEARPDGHAWLYVGGFRNGEVVVVDVDPAAPWNARVVKRIGGPRA